MHFAHFFPPMEPAPAALWPLLAASAHLPDPTEAPRHTIIGLQATATWDGNTVTLQVPRLLVQSNIPFPEEDKLSDLLANQTPIPPALIPLYAQMVELEWAAQDTELGVRWAPTTPSTYDTRHLWIVKGAVALLHLDADQGGPPEDAHYHMQTHSVLFHGRGTTHHETLAYAQQAAAAATYVADAVRYLIHSE